MILDHDTELSGSSVIDPTSIILTSMLLDWLTYYLRSDPIMRTPAQFQLPRPSRTIPSEPEVS